MDVVYLDFQKTFDKVPHQRLLLKQKDHGLGNKMPEKTCLKQVMNACVEMLGV